ncbi:MAG TPA: hypothetical protein VG206_18760 [Terriglobia bacterium]|nr:hypothetical protein [Terriglobia bacterium]
MILTEARREFQGKNPNTQPVRDIRRAEDYLLERMTPLFSGAVKAGDVDADTARHCVREFFDSLREGNSDTLLAIRLTRPVHASDMPEGNPGALLAGVLRHHEQELLASEKWLKFTQEIAKADDTRRRAQAPTRARASGSAIRGERNQTVAARRAELRNMLSGKAKPSTEAVCMRWDSHDLRPPEPWQQKGFDTFLKAWNDRKFRPTVKKLVSDDIRKISERSKVPA